MVLLSFSSRTSGSPTDTTVESRSNRCNFVCPSPVGSFVNTVGILDSELQEYENLELESSESARVYASCHHYHCHIRMFQLSRTRSKVGWLEKLYPCVCAMQRSMQDRNAISDSSTSHEDPRARELDIEEKRRKRAHAPLGTQFFHICLAITLDLKEYFCSHVTIMNNVGSKSISKLFNCSSSSAVIQIQFGSPVKTFQNISYVIHVFSRVF